ncbi:hypothetical protein PRIC1_007583 [Phytophthora ramorum]|nr:Zinc finger MYND domain-containing protein 10 [Phytophthora ramorum]
MLGGVNAALGIAPCENCGQPSSKRCSRCKAFSVCRQACMVAAWHKHKPDCDKVVEARKQLEAAGTSVSGEPCLMDPETVMRLNHRGLAMYDKHGVNEPPGRGSTMPLNKKLAFFLDVLKVHDTSSPEIKDLPLAEKMFLNRRYNNTYRHAVDTFSASELSQLHALMRTHHVGNSNR